TEDDLELLGLLAERVAAEIDWRERERAPGRPLGTFRYLALVDEVNEIYNARALRDIACAIARRALWHEESFALVGLTTRESPPLAPSQASLLAGALRRTAGPRDIVGWIDEDGLGAVLARTDQGRAERFLETALAAAEGAAVGALLVDQGALSANHL